MATRIHSRSFVSAQFKPDNIRIKRVNDIKPSLLDHISNLILEKGKSFCSYLKISFTKGKGLIPGKSKF